MNGMMYSSLLRLVKPTRVFGPFPAEPARHVVAIPQGSFGSM